MIFCFFSSFKIIQICWKSSRVTSSRVTQYARRANVRFPFIVSSLPNGNGSEVDQIGSRAENQYEELFRNRTAWTTSTLKSQSEARFAYRIYRVWSMISAELYDNCARTPCWLVETISYLSFLFAANPIEIIKIHCLYVTVCFVFSDPGR